MLYSDLSEGSQEICQNSTPLELAHMSLQGFLHPQMHTEQLARQHLGLVSEHKVDEWLNSTRALPM